MKDEKSYRILGISCFYHDSAAALVQDGIIIAAAQEERFTRKKQDDGFPARSIEYCLNEGGIDINELDAIVFYDKPLLKFERLLETYHAFAPRGLMSFIAAIPIWLKKKMFLKRVIYKELSEISLFDKRNVKLLFTEHHLSHAASAFYPSKFAESAILTIDGVGEWATASISYGKSKHIKVIKELNFPHSLGLLYSAFTYYMGFKVNSGEYKLMGLAPYGRPSSERVKHLVELIKTKLVHINKDGSLYMDQKYFDYATGLRMAKDQAWFKLFGIKKRLPEGELTQEYCDLAMAIQVVTEEIVLLMAAEAKKLTGVNSLCLAGGVALNCVANGKLKRAGIFDHIYIQPAAGDAGGALGAALACHYIYFDQERQDDLKNDAMQGSYLGPSFDEKEILQMVKRQKANFVKHDSFEALVKKVSGLLNEGQVIGWFQGRMEFGPRALGNRSILGDPRNAEMQKKLNLKIKYRESFRPFAPSVLIEDAGDYFDLKEESPYMLLVDQVKSNLLKALPVNYEDLDLKSKLYFQRSELPSVTHIDNSARIQTVDSKSNERYWKLINAFKELTGCSVIVNTSFNVRGEPIVCTPEDAYRCFMRTEMDYLIIGDLLFDKKEQPAWMGKDNWKEEFVLD